MSSQPAIVDAPAVDSGHSMGDINNEDNVDHTAQLSDRMVSLYLSATDADVVFLVAGERVPAHRLLLAAHNDYFRTLLCSGSSASESTQPEIELVDCGPSADAFRALLRYVYSGRMPLAGRRMPVDLELGVLALAHRFGLAALELAIVQHLPKVMAVANVCAIVDVARLYGLDELHEACLRSMDRSAELLLLEPGFIGLSGVVLCALLRRDSFCAPELKIFGAVREWCVANAATAGEDMVAEVKSLVRLNLVGMDQLLKVVRPTGFYSLDRILDVVDEISTEKEKPSNRRATEWPGRNVASREFGAKVVGDAAGTHNLLYNDVNFTKKGYLSHPITDGNDEGIVVELGTVCIINHVKLLLWDGDRRSYRYYVEVSVDRVHWERCVDHTEYDCRSWQWLYFSARPVKYVKLVGTHNTENTTFHVVSMETSYVRSPVPVVEGFVAPRSNVATVERGALFTVEGRVVKPTYGSIPIKSHINVVIQLGQPCWLDSMRLRFQPTADYDFVNVEVETSTDMQTWQSAVFRMDHPQSWQSWTIESRSLVIYVRIVGLNPFANEGGYTLNFECSSQVLPPAGVDQ